MKINYIVSSVVITITIISSLSAQKPTSSTFTNKEQQLRQIFKSIRDTNDYKVRTTLSSDAEIIFDSILSQKESFKYPFDSLKKYITCLYSDDMACRIINWNIPNPDATYSYFAYVQRFSKGEDTLITTKLIDKHQEIAKPEKATLKSDNWYGAL